KRLHGLPREKYAHSATESNPLSSRFGGRPRRSPGAGDSGHRRGVRDTGMVFAKGAGRGQASMRLRIPTHLFRATAAVAAVIGLAAASPARADEARRLPTFTSDVDVVNLNVSVTDGRDRYVTGLAAGDFEIFEDGVRQQLCLFTQERLPISLAVMVDSSLSMQNNLPAVKTAALRLLRVLRPGDQAEVR